jgi:hypothetical protein
MSGDGRDASKNGAAKALLFRGGKTARAWHPRDLSRPIFDPKIILPRRMITRKKTSMLLQNKISPGRNHFSCSRPNGCFRLPSPRHKKVEEMVRQRPALATGNKLGNKSDEVQRVCSNEAIQGILEVSPRCCK